MARTLKLERARSDCWRQFGIGSQAKQLQAPRLRPRTPLLAVFDNDRNLGRDAGGQVLQAQIARGVSDRIKTVLWFSDLRNYTRISDSAPSEEIVPLLNDYAAAIVSTIHQH
jgi:class 3 adenylate cyclase